MENFFFYKIGDNENYFTNCRSHFMVSTSFPNRYLNGRKKIYIKPMTPHGEDRNTF